MEFEWDLGKESDNIRKHDVSFLEAVESFADPDGFSMMDTKHSENEMRYYWVGKSGKGRILTTRYTWRGNKIRIIGSAEWREFRREYSEKTGDKKSDS